MYFFDVTESLFQKVVEAIKTVINTITPIIGSVAVVFLVVITIGLSSSKSKKKYINDNFVMIVLVLCVEGLISILFFDNVFIKINLLALVICLFILILKTKSKKRKIKKILIEEVK